MPYKLSWLAWCTFACSRQCDTPVVTDIVMRYSAGNGLSYERVNAYMSRDLTPLTIHIYGVLQL